MKLPWKKEKPVCIITFSNTDQLSAEAKASIGNWLRRSGSNMSYLMDKAKGKKNFRCLYMPPCRVLDDGKVERM